MAKTILTILNIFLFCACGTGLKINKSNFKPINNNFSGSFKNFSYKTKGRNYDPTLLNLFNIFDIASDTIIFKINSNGQLQLTFKDSLKIKTEIFKGNFSKKGYYEIYFRKIKKEIPPLVPIIYGYRDIDRIRIGLTINNDLVVDNKWATDGNIFILAAGSAGRSQSFLKKIK